MKRGWAYKGDLIEDVWKIDVFRDLPVEEKFNPRVEVVVFEAEKIEEVKAGILKAIETINAFHGETAWDLYQGSPEMRIINKALAILEGNDGN